MDLSIIILSYNTKDITDECLRRLQFAVDRVQEKTGDKVQVIVLDNASADSSAQMIKKNHPWVELIESKENTGFSKGNNIAFKKAKYSAVLFLNSDVYVEKETLEKSLEYFKNHNCDVLGVKLTFENGKLQPSGGSLPNPLNIILWILGLSYLPILGQLTDQFHPRQSSFFSKDHQVGWTSGAFFQVKREVFEKVGGFDEEIFMYMDEVDLCKRIENAGYKVYFTPSIKVVHIHRASSKDNPESAFTKEIIGVNYYLKKYYSNYYFLIKQFLILGSILRILAFSLLGKTKIARAYMEGLGAI